MGYRVRNMEGRPRELLDAGAAVLDTKTAGGLFGPKSGGRAVTEYTVVDEKNTGDIGIKTHLPYESTVRA